ncbi:hypothetical protein WJX77_005452 [Trebouxia sp. C0004]
MHRLLLLALIMGGAPFAFVANLWFQHFLHCLRPSFVPPGQTMLRGSLLDENIAEIVIKIMHQYGPKKFTGIVTDNARSMVNMRTIVVNTFPHIIECRCMMHCFSTCMGSVMGHHFATTIKGDRKVKPERDIQAVLQKEEDLQRLETLAIADAVAEEGNEAKLHVKLEKHPEAINSDGSEGGTGYTPLHYAARAGHLGAVRMLLARGADPNRTTGAGGATALHRACYMGHTAVAEALQWR